MYSSKNKAFTLVELIVVVTILAILATIGFVSYSSYLTGVRDTNRLAQLVSIHDGLELYRTRNDLPLPDENVDVVIGSDPIAYQGYAGSNTLETIDFTKGGLDPRDKSYFSYYLTADRKYFQLMAFLEEEANITTQNTNVLPPLLRGTEGELSLIQQTQAVDYSARIPTIYGKKLGILTNDQNTPIQEDTTISEIDLQNTSMELIARFSDNTQIYGTGGSIITAMAIKNPKLALLDDSLVGFWNFEKTKNGKLFDYSKNLTDGICYSAGKNINCKTTQDGTMTFNGEDEYVELDNSFNYYGARGNTIYVSGQINEKSSSGNYDGFIGNYCGNPGIYGLALKALNNNIELRDYSVEGSDPVWNNYTSNKKFSFTSTIDFISAEYKLYVDNDLIDTRTTTTVSPPIESNCPFRFGHIYGSMGSPAYLNGEIDTIRIYNKPLSLELIKLLATTQD